MKRVLNNQPDATPCGSTDNRKRNKTANLLHPFKNGAGKLLLTLSLLLASVGAWAQTFDGYYKYYNRGNTAYYLSVSNNNYQNNPLTPYLCSSNTNTGDEAIWAVYSYNRSTILVHATDGRIIVTHDATAGAQKVHLESVNVANNNNILFTQTTSGNNPRYYWFRPNASVANTYLNPYGGNPNDIGLYTSTNDNGNQWRRTTVNDAPTIAAPTISSSNRGRTVSLACTNTYARIYYTTDGTNPTTSSTRYTGSFNITETKTIKARAYVGFIKADGTFEVVSQSNVTTQRVEVLTTPTTLTFANASPTVTPDGWGIQLPAVTLKANETTVTGRTITYSGTGCNVNNNGTVTGIQDAGATITATFAGDDTYAASSATYIITGTIHAALNETVIKDIAITPATADLDLDGTQEYSIPASVSATTRTCELYKEFACPTGAFYSYASNNNWQYTLTKPTVNENTGATVNLTRVNWSYSGGQGQYFQPTATNNKVTLTRTNQKTDHNQEFTITANAAYGSADKTATAKVTILKTVVDITNLYAGTAINLQYGEAESIAGHFSWLPNSESAGETYKNFTYTSQNENVATVDANGKVTAVGPGTTTITLQSMKINGDVNTGVSCAITVNVSISAPKITIDKDGNVAIEAPNGAAGVQIRYTTNGTDPTATTGTEYNTTFGPVANETTVKAVAVANGVASAVASQTYVTSGVSGTKVILNDYEDHNWTYYAGVDPEVDGGNYNTNYVGKLYSPNPRNVKITYNATNGAAVSINEAQTTFVYYKTLEEGATAERYPYQVISNPFSKRPAHSGTTYYGFAGWKVTRGYEYMRHANGTAVTKDEVLALDESIYFTGLPYPSVNCTSAEIVFETTWTTANRTYINTNPGSNQTYTFNSGTYETNFVVINVNYSRQITIAGSATIMMVEPDGSADYRGRSFSNLIVPATGANNVTKIEWANWNPSGNIDARGRNFTIGRGVTTSTSRELYGTNQAAGAANIIDQVLKVESGTYSYFRHFTSSGTNRVRKQIVVFGCDYDRANSDNAKLRITGRMIGAEGSGAANEYGTHDANLFMSKTYMKSGTFMSNVDLAGADYAHSYYLGINAATVATGKRLFEMEGGYLASSIAGGMDIDMTGTKNSADYINVYVRIRGGRIRGCVYGAARFRESQGSRQIVMTGGEVNSWIAGGANGDETTEGATNGASYIYVGGNAIVGGTGSNTSIGSSIGGCVYGAGCGYSPTSSSGNMMLGTNVVVADNAYVERGVYGGGAFGYCATDKTANIYITGGHVEGKSGNYTDRANTTTNGIIGGVFGGARMRYGGSANIYMTGGWVETGVYGGSNYTGTMEHDVKMVITGGKVGTDATHTGNVHGGGYGQETRVSGNVDLSIGTRNTETGALYGNAVIYGDVYGGSALGYVNGTTATTTYHTNVTLNAGTINGSLYGGALGSNTVEANVYGPVSVTVNGGVLRSTDQGGLGAVFGCNNKNGSPQGKVTVDVTGGEMEYIYGGGNAAPYTVPTPNSFDVFHVHMSGGLVHKHVFGGGLGTNAVLTGNTEVKVTGGSVVEGNVYGGGNGALVTGNTNIVIGDE